MKDVWEKRDRRRSVFFSQETSFWLLNPEKKQPANPQSPVQSLLSFSTAVAISSNLKSLVKPYNPLPSKQAEGGEEQLCALFNFSILSTSLQSHRGYSWLSVHGISVGLLLSLY